MPPSVRIVLELRPAGRGRLSSHSHDRPTDRATASLAEADRRPTSREYPAKFVPAAISIRLIALATPLRSLRGLLQ